MAHKNTTKREPKEFLTFPLRFNASLIELIGDAVQVGDWIVGYPPSLIPGEEDRFIDHASFSIGADQVEDFLSRGVSDAGSHSHDGDVVRRFLLRHGTFRQWDWYRLEEVLRSGVPQEVKKELARVNPRPGSKLYVLSVKQFYQEWELLRRLAIIAGKLAEKPNPLLVKSDAEAAQEILRDLSSSRFLPPIRPNSEGAELESLFGVAAANKSSHKPIGSHLSLAESVRIAITSLCGSAFQRGIGEGKFGVAWGRLNVGPRVALNVQSTLGLAYLGLLANFSRGWKCCAREDCGNIFRVTDDKRKQFCSQYCGHVVSLRKNREKARTTNRRFRSR